jgi:hypothetical protein
MLVSDTLGKPSGSLVNSRYFEILKHEGAYYFIQIRNLGSNKVRNLFTKIMGNQALLAYGTGFLIIKRFSLICYSDFISILERNRSLEHLLLFGCRNLRRTLLNK